MSYFPRPLTDVERHLADLAQSMDALADAAKSWSDDNPYERAAERGRAALVALAQHLKPFESGSARIDVKVLDPGISGDRMGGDYCVAPNGLVRDHKWMLVMVDGEGSTSFCTECRRIERRTVIEDVPF